MFPKDSDLVELRLRSEKQVCEKLQGYGAAIIHLASKSIVSLRFDHANNSL